MQPILLTDQPLTTNKLASLNDQSPASSGWLPRFSTRAAPPVKNDKTGSVRSSSSSKSHEAKAEHQRISIEAKRIHQQFEKKDNRRTGQTSRREDFLARSSELWTHEILPYWQKYGDLHLTVNSEIYKLWWHGLPPRKFGYFDDRPSSSSLRFAQVFEDKCGKQRLGMN